MRIFALLFLLMGTSCQYYNGKLPVEKQAEDSTEMVQAKVSLPSIEESSKHKINTGGTKPEQLLAFAESLIGVRYRYGSTDPVNGFDCSGFITYVFNHFDISVPRSSID